MKNTRSAVKMFKFELKDRVWVNGKILADMITENPENSTFPMKIEKPNMQMIYVRTCSNMCIYSGDYIQLNICDKNEIIELYNDNNEPISRININGMFVHIVTMPADEDIVMILITKVPYDLYTDQLEFHMYPKVWVSEECPDIFNPPANCICQQSKALRIAMNSYHFPDAYCDGPTTDLVLNTFNVLMSHINIWHKSNYGICKGAICPLYMGKSTADSIFKGNLTEVQLYMISDLSEDCPYMSGNVTLSRFDDTNKVIQLRFDEFMYRYRGVWSKNSIVIEDKFVHLCMNGIRIKRGISSKLQNLIEELSMSVNDIDFEEMTKGKRIYKGMPTNDIAEDIFHILMSDYASGKITDEVLILQKDFMYSIPVIKNVEE